MTNSEWIAVAILGYILLGIIVAWLIDREEEGAAECYKEGCGCWVAVLLTVFCSILGGGALFLFNQLGWLGAWYTWILPATLPFIVIAIFWFVAVVSERGRNEQSNS